jgi:hypothetical protein
MEDRGEDHGEDHGDGSGGNSTGFLIKMNSSRSRKT